MIKALRQPQIFRLWVGQAFSSIGDEIYRVGLAWFAVKLMGADVGYLTAGQTASLMLLSFIGGKWADHWNPLKTMIGTDLLRGFIVLVPVAISFFIAPPMTILWVMALSLAALSAFFDPAVQTIIPVLANDRETIQSTTGLMSTTTRMARMIGPAIVGLMSAFIPMIHFFTLDAFTFIASAVSVFSIRRFVPENFRDSQMKRSNFWDALTSGFGLVRDIPGMPFVFYGKGIASGCWNLALMVGFPYLIHEMTNGDSRAFGLVMASYGIGNFAGSLWFGNRPRTRHYWLLFAGYFYMGIGFILIGLAPTIIWVMIAAAVAGLVGPMNDLGMIDIIQTQFALKDLTKVFRLRMALESASTLFFALNAPWMIKSFGIRTVIIVAGSIWVVNGLLGFTRLKALEEREVG